MPGLLTPEIARLTAWPKEILYKDNGRIGGFLMERMGTSKDIHSLYGPKSRLTEFPHADWRLLVRSALNLSRAFHVLHQAGCLVADVNHGGIRVAADGTIKIIDCDSFQITRDGRVYLCEVGTDQFTPPELQQKSFRQTARTPNHDNFGLAVLIFHLLQMGRHPFAGRYRGPEEMPIPKAIGQFRYAYSSNTSLTNMEPPPHTAKPHAASPELAKLWEQAFGRSGAAVNGRPVAADWVAALSRLEKSFSQCSANPTHFFFQGNGSCPWCPIESIGIILFGISINGNGGSGVNVEALWKQIQGVQNPGSLSWSWSGSTIGIKPSSKATTAKAKRNERRSVGLVVGVVVFFAGASVAGSMWLLWIIVASIAGFWIANSANGGIEQFLEVHRQLANRKAELLEQYASRIEVDAFDSKVNELTRVHIEHGNLASERQRRYQELVKNRQKHALGRYLDKFRIDRASISGIGPARSAMLESYGIETASDVDEQAILRVPGFGSVLAWELVAWRKELERSFRFNPASEVDRGEVLALDRAIAIKRTELEKKLRVGPAILQQIRQSILSRRSALAGELEKISTELAQAKMDLDLLQ